MLSDAVLSLTVFVCVLFIGILRKINTGLLALGGCFLLCGLTGAPVSVVFGGFNVELFLTLLGTSLLFCVAIQNGAMQQFSQRVLALAGGRGWLVPILFGLVAFGLSASGPGNLATGALTTPLAINLALHMQADPVFLSLVNITAVNVGCIAPTAIGGIVASRLAQDTVHAGGFEKALFHNGILLLLCFFVLIYVIFKGYGIKGQAADEKEVLPKLNWQQICTLLAIGLMVIGTMVMGLNVGLTATFLGVILLALGFAREREVMQLMPWGTFMLVCGMSSLVKLVIHLEGLALFTELLTGVMTRNTAVPVMALCGGVVSLFASTLGVVIPALMPVLPEIAQNFGVPFGEMVSAVILTSFFATVSPLSTGGSGIIARYIMFLNIDGEEQHRLFLRLLKIACLSMLLGVALSAVGFFRIFS